MSFFDYDDAGNWLPPPVTGPPPPRLDLENAAGELIPIAAEYVPEIDEYQYEFQCRRGQVFTSIAEGRNLEIYCARCRVSHRLAGLGGV